MGQNLNTENMYALLMDHIKYCNSAYKRYASVVNDEALRKFFRSMSGQEEANLDEVEKLSSELKACFVDAEKVSSIVKDLNTTYKPEAEVPELERIEFLQYMLAIKKLSETLYMLCEESCQAEAAVELLHSLYKEEKRLIALLQDRFELEQLLH